MNKEVGTAVALYRKKFKSEPTVAVFAPGRVNLIGEHTDYNDGFVLPFALPYRTVIVGARAENTTKCTIISNAKGLPPSTFELNDSLCKGSPEWANYVKGALYQYLPEIPPGSAFNAVIVSNVPIGSGLSSSAALEVATSTFVEQLFHIRSVTGVNKALRCQKAEHTFADMPCGIMDQYISAMGKAGNLLLIDCRSHDYTLVPYGEGEECPLILVTNSNVKHKLTGSEYPDRVKQCKEAVRILQAQFPHVKALRDATVEMVEAAKGRMSQVVYRRAKHCVSEDRRTLAAVEALEKKDYKTVGEMMTASHRSLQHDYEVSCPELDFLVDVALTVPGVYGSRITGGGFGGCTVTLVERSAVKALEQALQQRYSQELKLRCDCYECLPSDGSGPIDLTPYLGAAAQHTYTAETASEDEELPNMEDDLWDRYGGPLVVAALVVAVAVGTAVLLRQWKK